MHGSDLRRDIREIFYMAAGFRGGATLTLKCGEGEDKDVWTKIMIVKL